MGGYFEPQYCSGGVAARWLQHLSSTSSPSASAINPPPTIAMQSAEEKQKLYKLMRSASTGAESFSYGSSRHNMSDGLELLGEEDASGLLDLHSLDDTELLSEDAMPDPFESSPLIHMRERGYENNVDNALCSTNKPHGSSKHTIYSDISPMRSSLIDKESNGNDSSGPARIKVVVRKRPLNKKEISRKEEDIVGIVEHGCSLTVHEPKLKVDLTAYVERHDFMFDAVLGEHVTNDEVYGVTVEPIIPTIFKRTKATCFAYGQTGSGKTYTMRPLPLKASQDILKMMQHSLYRNQGLQLWLSFFEIYGGKLYDLLNDRRKLCMREDGRQQVCIVGLKEFSVSDVQLVNGYIEKGNAARSTGSTGANEESSRSHAILQLVLKKHIGGKDDQGGRVVGKFSFIDLAGSERGADTTDNDRQTRIEGAEINKSLLALKECIRALDHEQGHIPFRGSKLTEVLRDSFIGDSRTVMISCISPNSGSCEHTLNTLRYADRVKGLSKNSNSKRDPSPNTAPNASTLTRCDSSPPSFSSSEVSEYAKGFRNTESIRSGWNVQYGDSEGHSITSSNHIQSGRDSKPAYFPSGKDRYAVQESNVASFSNRQDISGMHGSFDRGEHDRLTSLHQRSNNNEKFDNLGDSNLKDQGKGDGVGTWQRQQIYKEEATMDTVQSILKEPAQSTDFQNGYDRHIAAILEEEEDLISAHRLEVEDSMELVREEMKLLAVIDQPGSRIDQYVSQLSYVLSRKAAGIVNLQERLARFQRHLKEHEIISHNLG